MLGKRRGSWFFPGVTTDAPSRLEVLPARVWRERAEAHRLCAERWIAPARERRVAKVPHPIDDFLFTYYPFSFGKLLAWHPPQGAVLEVDSATGLPECWSKSPYVVRDGLLFRDPALLEEKERQRLGWIAELLEATRDRAPNFACHGLHEWAMVYRGVEVRHAETAPLRLPQEEIDALVESRPIRCSHFDAFRFFAAEAKPLNRLQPSLMERAEFEQPGCIHANMDLYKWAFKAMPWTGSGLLFDCFEQAVALRDLDMRASPYDLAKWGCEPVKIETPEGRRDYEKEQRALSETTAELRRRVIAEIRGVLAEAGA